MTDEGRSWGDLIVRGVRTAALVLVVLIAVGSTAAVLSGRYQARPVLTGSMRPGLPIGGVVVTKRVPISSLQVRDVIVFHRPDSPDELVVHRIVALHRVAGNTVIRTKGDDNPVQDPWKVTLRGSTAYRAEFSVPLVGYASIWWHQPLTRTIALSLAGVCALAAMLILLISTMLGRRTPTDESLAHASEPAPDDPESQPTDSRASDQPGADVPTITNLAEMAETSSKS